MNGNSDTLDRRLRSCMLVMTGLGAVLLASGLPAEQRTAQTAESESTLYCGPLPLAQISAVEVEQPVDIKRRGKPEPHRRLYLLVGRPTGHLEEPATNAPPRRGRSKLPPMLPILHVDEYRAQLVNYDRDTGTSVWLIPQVDLNQAFIWYPYMTTDSAEFWERSFWPRGLSLDDIAARAQVAVMPDQSPDRPKRPSYQAEELPTVSKAVGRRFQSAEDIARYVRQHSSGDRSAASQPGSAPTRGAQPDAEKK